MQVDELVRILMLPEEAMGSETTMMDFRTAIPNAIAPELVRIGGAVIEASKVLTTLTNDDQVQVAMGVSLAVIAGVMRTLAREPELLWPVVRAYKKLQEERVINVN